MLWAPLRNLRSVPEPVLQRLGPGAVLHSPEASQHSPIWSWQGPGCRTRAYALASLTRLRSLNMHECEVSIVGRAVLFTLAQLVL
jgi:hypothetical protein